MYAPIALFVYSRPLHTKRTIESLSRCSGANESELVIFSDGPKSYEDHENVSEVRKYISNISGFKAITTYCRQENLGLAKSVIQGISDIFKKYENVIIIEDDLIFHQDFIFAINNMLTKYQHYEEIGTVTGYSLPIQIPASYNYDFYYSLRHSSWGWGTWKRVWEAVDWGVADYKEFLNNPINHREFNRAGPDMVNMLKRQIHGEIDSWSIVFDYNMYKMGIISVATRVNLVQNTGFDGSGTHCGAVDIFHNEMPEFSNIGLNNFPSDFLVNSEIEINTYNFFKPNIFKGFFYLFIYKLKTLMKRN
jgi:hypothetical protein